MYGDTINSPESYTLIAEKKPIVLSDISPEIHGDIIDTVFTLKGAGFSHMTQVNLVSDESSYSADSIEVVGDGQAYARFIAKRIPAGIYSVEVVHDEGQTVIMVTHEPDIARHCHRIIRLSDGRVESDEPQVA